MFSKKPVPPPAPWAVRLLTTDFLIDGYCSPEAHSESGPFFSPQTDAAATGTLWLASPRFTPVAAGSGAPPAVNNWVVPYSGNYVGLMPFDDASLAGVRKYAASYKHAFPVALHAGPYAIRGQLLSSMPELDNLYVLLTHASLPLQEVEVEYRLAGAQFTGLKAPLMLVRTHWVQGFGLISQ